MVKVDISVQGLNLYWSEKGYKNFDGEPIQCCWDDVDYTIHFPDGTVKEGGTVAETRKYFRHEINELKGRMGLYIEEKFPGIVEEELNETSYGISMEELTKIDHLIWGFYYDDPDDPDKFEIEDMIDLPKNEHGLLPNLISACLPTEILTKKDLEGFILEYTKKFFGVKDEIEVFWVNTPTDETLEREYQDYINQCKAWDEAKKKGEKPKVLLLPQVLKGIIGEDTVNELLNRGMIHAEIKTNEIVLYFKDKTIEMLKVDFLSDANNYLKGL